MNIMFLPTARNRARPLTGAVLIKCKKKFSFSSNKVEVKCLLRDCENRDDIKSSFGNVLWQVCNTNACNCIISSSLYRVSRVRGGYREDWGGGTFYI